MSFSSEEEYFFTGPHVSMHTSSSLSRNEIIVVKLSAFKINVATKLYNVTEKTFTKNPW